MKFLRIRKSQTRVTLDVDLRDILKDPILGTHDNSIKFKTALQDAIKNNSEKFRKHCYPNVESSVGDYPLSIQFKNPHALQEYWEAIHSINNNSNHIYQKLINSPYINQETSLVVFGEHLYEYIFNEIVEYKKNNKKMSFIELEKSPYSLIIRPNLKELNFVNSFISSNFNISLVESIVKQFNEYSITYSKDEDLLTTVMPDKETYILVTAKNKETITYLADLCEGLNKHSNKIYEIATTDLHSGYFQKQAMLTEQFSNLINGFFATEMMDKDLPINSNPTIKRLKL